MTNKLTTCLWYDGAAREAAEFYVTLLPDSHIVTALKSPADNPSMKEGGELVVEFILAGQSFIGLNGGPNFKFNEAVSIQIHTEDQAETDRLWEAIVSNGGAESACSWCKDKWGMNWQIVPRRLTELMADPDPDVARRVMQAMMTMRKIDIAGIERAAEGKTSA
ncbi:VOC family protein [Sphingobium sp. CR28]|uniref:VOC family protein n=1 Tax=Sphingobium sp. CR28 TaxID=3400272 RepID=UPI003FF0A6FA